jgi:hypothetical protein
VSRSDTQLCARQPIFKLRQLMAARAKQQKIKPHTPCSAITARLPLPRRHASAVAPVAFSAVVRTVMCKPQDSSHLATHLGNKSGDAPVAQTDV